MRRRVEVLVLTVLLMGVGREVVLGVVVQRGVDRHGGSGHDGEEEGEEEENRARKEVARRRSSEQEAEGGRTRLMERSVSRTWERERGRGEESGGGLEGWGV